MEHEPIEDWRAMLNLSRSPFHPTLKAIIFCIFHSRDWESQQSCVSQSTIADSCGVDRRTVKRWIPVAEELGFFTIDVLGGHDFRQVYPRLAKFAKEHQRYTVYSFDFGSAIWQEMWTYEELCRKHPQAVQMKRSMPTGRKFKSKVNGDTGVTIDGDTGVTVNGDTDAADTTNSSSVRAEQVVSHTRRETNNVRSSSDALLNGRYGNLLNDLFGDINHD